MVESVGLRGLLQRWLNHRIGAYGAAITSLYDSVFFDHRRRGLAHLVVSAIAYFGYFAATWLVIPPEGHGKGLGLALMVLATITSVVVLEIPLTVVRYYQKRSRAVGRAINKGVARAVERLDLQSYADPLEQRDEVIHHLVEAVSTGRSIHILTMRPTLVFADLLKTGIEDTLKNDGHAAAIGFARECAEQLRRAITDKRPLVTMILPDPRSLHVQAVLRDRDEDLDLPPAYVRERARAFQAAMRELESYLREKLNVIYVPFVPQARVMLVEDTCIFLQLFQRYGPACTGELLHDSADHNLAAYQIMQFVGDVSESQGSSRPADEAPAERSTVQ